MQCHQHTFSAFIVGALLLALASCGLSGKAAKLVGTWRLNLGGSLTMTITYSKDHTYMATMAGPVSGSESGQWRIEGDQLIEKTETSTINSENIGKDDRLIIVKLDDSALILQSKDKAGKEETHTLQRVK